MIPVTDLRRALSEWLIGRAAKVRPMRDDTDTAFLVACAEAVRAGTEGPRVPMPPRDLELERRLAPRFFPDAEFGDSAPVLRQPRHDAPHRPPAPPPRAPGTKPPARPQR